MSKRVCNPSAVRTVTQINSTMEMMRSMRLCPWYNPVAPVNDADRRCQITWNNHVSGATAGSRGFTKLEQYLCILDSNSYHCLLFDGSVIRMNFVFEDDLLLEQNLLWWPSPYDFSELLEGGRPPVEIVESFYRDPNWHDMLSMRSPVRIDFDSLNGREDHPYCHLHIQSGETRLSIDQPICFNRFVDFIFRNFYPQLTLTFSPYDYITYKTPRLRSFQYTPSQIVI